MCRSYRILIYLGWSYPALGNHDWKAGNIDAHLDYRTLPGSERHYDFVRGPVHFFVRDSKGDSREPDGNSSDSLQADWLQANMDGSQTPWHLVVLHHPPYTSSLLRGDNEALQWPFAAGARRRFLPATNTSIDNQIKLRAVTPGMHSCNGHESLSEHFYECGYADGIPQFVVGAGGKWKGISPVGRFGFWPTPGSRVRYNQDYGAMLVTANERCINFSFYSRGDELIDSYTTRKQTEARLVCTSRASGIRA